MKSHRLHNILGEQKDQFLILCDENGKPTGQASREDCHVGEGKRHLAFMAYIYDADGRMIFARRGMKKTLWPGFWDAAVVSHVLKGETPESAALRRGKEELGVDVTFKIVGSFPYHANYDNRSENEYCYVLVGKTNDLAVANPVEISEIDFIDRDNLDRWIKDNKDQLPPWFQIAWRQFSKQITNNR
jgi:isopentenyl-diphosphate delta-isomerase